MNSSLADSEAEHTQPVAAAPDKYDDDTGWEKIREKDGITTLKKEVPGSPLLMMKGKCVMDGTVSKVISVLFDASRATEWVDLLIEGGVLEKKSNYEEVIYSHFKSPMRLLFHDRDFVYLIKLGYDKKTKAANIDMKSIVHPSKPETDNPVRGEIYFTYYHLEPVENGKKVSVVAVVQTNLKGSMPNWIANMIQKDWPYNTLDGLRRQVGKADIKELPFLKDLIVN